MKTYLDIALRDLHSAKIMLDAGVYNNAVRFCQQYVEKLFKEKIHTAGSSDSDQFLLHTHRITKLAARCEVLAGIKFSKDETILFGELTNYYFDTNYPGGDYVEVDKQTAESIYNQTLEFQENHETKITRG
ncbi:MAG: HEPN domain-containing protein [Defluviitaleaceae bacterium]|nr:HEPN domain-containing protein [Defluviitaleaceae bacterium]MCL2263643.1 HEPN domain-containing protein [Defluviitaleaceae bacterium]